MLYVRQPLKFVLVGWAVVLLALAVFGCACFVMLQLLFDWPDWVDVLISVPVAIGFFAFYVSATQTNGFDGPMISMDELRAKLQAMTPSERLQYLAEFSQEDREVLEQELGVKIEADGSLTR